MTAHPRNSLRLGTVADVDAILCFRQDLYAHDPAAMNARTDRIVLTELLTEPTLGRAWLIENEVDVVGYAIVTYGFSIEFAGRFGLIDELYVVPARRGLGIGTDVLKQIENALLNEGVAAIRLEVERFNLAAERLYRRFGFEAHDRNLMTKWLKRS